MGFCNHVKEVARLKGWKQYLIEIAIKVYLVFHEDFSGEEFYFNSKNRVLWAR